MAINKAQFKLFLIMPIMIKLSVKAENKTIFGKA